MLILETVSTLRALVSGKWLFRIAMEINDIQMLGIEVSRIIRLPAEIDE